MANQPGKIRTYGLDNYVRLGIPKWELYIGATITIPKYAEQNVSNYIAYTPLFRSATTLVFEPDENWRFGLEASFNGIQYRTDLSVTSPYTFVATMIGYKYKKFTFVLNCENLLDVRQTRFENIVIPPISNPRFKTLWAPIDGIVANFSIKYKIY